MAGADLRPGKQFTCFNSTKVQILTQKSPTQHTIYRRDEGAAIAVSNAIHIYIHMYIPEKKNALRFFFLLKHLFNKGVSTKLSGIYIDIYIYTHTMHLPQYAGLLMHIQ